MNNIPMLTEFDSPYPGSYVPKQDTECRNVCGENCSKQQLQPPPFEVADDDDGYLVTVDLPGLSREDILVHVDDKVLEVTITSRQPLRSTTLMKNTRSVETSDCRAYISLPANADLDFVSAEYDQGRLYFQIPKTPQTVQTTVKQIVIY